jgi:hypothetical protein
MASDYEFTDPAGDEHERDRLRGLRKWHFILCRGVLGFGATVFLWLAMSNLHQDIKMARSLHSNVVQFVLLSWLSTLFMVGFLGCVVGYLAWKRLTSDYWPGREADTESEQIRLGL